MDHVAARLASRRLVKVIIGLTHFDLAEIRDLTRVYTFAGADIIDVAAAPDVVAAARAAMSGIENEFPGHGGATRLMVSAALAHDPHIEGVRLDPAHRSAIAPTGPAQLADTVSACLALGAEMVEVHASDSDDSALTAALEGLHPVLGDRYLSVCLGTHGVRSSQDVIRQASLARRIHGEATMIQAEGLSAAGRADPASSLAGLALAQALLAHTDTYVLVAGAANHWTRHTAEVLGVRVHGVASGTYARDLVKAFQATSPRDPGWEPAARVARAFVDQLRGAGERDG